MRVGYICLVYICIRYGMMAQDGKCPSRQSGTLDYSLPMNRHYDGYADQRLRIYCCMKGYDIIKWYKEENSSWVQIKNIDNVGFSEDNQTMDITLPHIKELYIKCKAVNYTSENYTKLETNISVHIEECQLPTFFTLREPLYNALDVEKFPSTLSFNCSIDINCKSQHENEVFILWKLPPTFHETCEKNERGPSDKITCKMYTTENLNDGSSGLFTQQLTIYNITKSDIGSTFKCIFETDGQRPVKNYQGEFVRYVNVTLKDANKEINQSWGMSTMAIILISFLAVFVILIITVLSKMSGLPSKLRLLMKINYCLENQTVYEKCAFDFGIIHTEKEYARNCASNLRQDLEDLAYNVTVFEEFQCKTCGMYQFTPEKITEMVDGQGIEEMCDECYAILIIPFGMELSEWDPYISGLKFHARRYLASRKTIAIVMFHSDNLPIELKTFKIIKYVAKKERCYRRKDFLRTLTLLLPAQRIKDVSIQHSTNMSLMMLVR